MNLRTSRHIASVLVLSLLPSFAMAKEPAKKPDSKKEEVASEKEESEAKEDEVIQSYEGGMRGLKSLMKNLKEENPKVHETLMPEFKKLRRRYNTGMSIFVGGSVAGLAMTGIGFAQFIKSMDDDDSDGKGFGLFAAGLGVSVLSYWVSAPFFPNEQDYKDFTNKHNKINKKSQIRWERASLMLNENKLPMLALGFSF